MAESGETHKKPLGVREWYDFIGGMAEFLPGIHLGGRQATETLLEMCRLEPESYVLDVGCGSGITACLLAKRYEARVQGVDISEVMITQARKRAHRLGVTGRVRFQASNVFELPFEDGTFDAAIVESVLTTLPGEKTRALSEMVRVVQPGGCIAANESTLDPSTPQEYLELLDEHPAIQGYFTPNSLRVLFEQAGLQDITAVDNREGAAVSAVQEMGLGGLLSFMVRVYPRILLKLLRDARYRAASRIDDAITKRGKPYMGYTLIVGQKPTPGSASE